MTEKKKPTYSKRRQQVHRQFFIFGLVMLLIAAVGVCSYIGYTKKVQKVHAEAQAQKQKAQDQTVDEEQPESSEERLARVRQEAQEKEYPQGVIALLDKNPATVDYVENYEEKKDLPPADDLGITITPGEIPQILQWDERWGYAPYGTSNVAVSGCGPTCMSMVVAGLTGDASVTPAKVAAYGTENGYLDEENNTYWEFMRQAGSNWGISCSEIAMKEEQIIPSLQAGHPVILSVGPGDFTQNGHFIVLTAYVDGKIRVNDPFSQENSDKLWEFEQLKNQTKGAWVYSYRE